MHIEATLQAIRTAHDEVGPKVLAEEAGVPLTTVRSYADRHWSHKNLDVLLKLSDAAARINRRTAKGKPAGGAA